MNIFVLCKIIGNNLIEVKKCYLLLLTNNLVQSPLFCFLNR